MIHARDNCKTKLAELVVSEDTSVSILKQINRCESNTTQVMEGTETWGSVTLISKRVNGKIRKGNSSMEQKGKCSYLKRCHIQ